MFFGNKRRRRPQSVSAPVQALEAREMKSATATYDGYELKVTGSPGDDKVLYQQYMESYPVPRLMNTVSLNGQAILSFEGPAPTRVTAKLDGGNDYFGMRTRPGASITTIDVSFGSFTNNAQFTCWNPSTATLTVDSRARGSTQVDLLGMTSRLSTRVTTSAPRGDLNLDLLYPNRSTDLVYSDGSKLGALNVNTGGGEDRVRFRDSEASSATIQLGAGNDLLELNKTALSNISIDGGSGYDIFRSSGSVWVAGTGAFTYFVWPKNFESMTFNDPTAGLGL